MLRYNFLQCQVRKSKPKILSTLTTLRPRRNEQHFADDIFKRIFFNENVWISIKISLKFVPKGPINNISALVQIIAWRRSVDKPLSDPMLVSLPTHICVTRPQWVNEQYRRMLSQFSPSPQPHCTRTFDWQKDQSVYYFLLFLDFVDIFHVYLHFHLKKHSRITINKLYSKTLAIFDDH